jgi:hypothetical protein
MANESDIVADIADAIARYLTEHPGAADTLGGIQRWWLSQQRPLHQTAHVQKALDWLVHRGMVEKRVLGDGQVIYTRSVGGPSPHTMH